MLEPVHPEDIKQEKSKDQRKFIVLPYRALKDKRFTIQKLRAFLTICSYANHKGNLWPSVEKLAEDMGIKQPTMQAHIKWLTERGYLVTINNSYTVGKHAKPRAIVYDPDNPPNSEDWQLAVDDSARLVQEKETLKEESHTLKEAMQSSEVVKAKPASLYRVWLEGLRNRFGLDHPYEVKAYEKLATQYSLEDFKKATGVYLNSRSSPPASVSIMLKK